MNKFKIISYRSNINDYLSDGIKVTNTDANDNLEMVEIFKEITQKYCDLHKYEFLFKFINFDDLNPIIENKKKYNILNRFTPEREKFENIILYKLVFMRDELNKKDSDYVALLDNDAFISNPNIKLESFVDEEHEFFASPSHTTCDTPQIFNRFIFILNKFINDYEIFNLYIKNKINGIKALNEKYKSDYCKILNEFVSDIYQMNEGFFICKNTEYMRTMFNLICENFYLSYLNKNYYTCSDGFLMFTFLRNLKNDDKFCFLPLTVQGHIQGAEDARYDVNKSFIQHNYGGVSIKDRVKYAKEIKNNKWWSSLNK